MKKLAIVIVLLSSVTAFTQSSFAQDNKEYNLKVNATELQSIGKGLGELPYKEAAPLIQKLQSQVMQQNSTASEPPKDAKPDAKAPQ